MTEMSKYLNADYMDYIKLEFTIILEKTSNGLNGNF
jgi:hypothetical protein